MIRVELFVLFGFACGVPIGALAYYAVRRYLHWRDSRVKRELAKATVRASIEAAPTDDLLEELSTRDDLNTENRNAS